ncbi:unnamed protein product, partial [Arctogadus glacialis]
LLDQRFYNPVGLLDQRLCNPVGLLDQSFCNPVGLLDQSFCNPTPLHLAVLSGQVRLVEALLRAGADPGQGDLEGRSPLHLAALAADEALLRPLLAHLGESHAHLVNMADYHGLHPLHLSVRRGGERCLRLLVGGGAKINAGEQKSGSSALHLAVRDNLFKVACYLITE